MFEFLDLTPIYEAELNSFAELALSEFEIWDKNWEMFKSCPLLAPQSVEPRKCIRFLGHEGPHYCHFSEDYERLIW